MKKVDLNKVIAMSSNLRYFRHVADDDYDTYLNSPVGTGSSLIDALRRAKEIIDEMDLSQKTSDEIKEVIKNFEKYDEKNASYRRDVSNNDKQYFKDASSHWFDRISNEAKRRHVFLLKSNYLLNLDNMIIGAKTFFNSSTWKNLPKIVKRDLDESSKCILFRVPTSSGIMSLRAVEYVLRMYYKNKTSKALPKNLNWKDIIVQLGKNEPDSTLIGHLDFLRDNLRNKLNHPDAVLNQNEAENIFCMIVITIETMLKEMN